MQIKFRKLSPGAVTPSYGTPGAAGLDLCACIPHTIYLQPGVRFKCPTGIAIELPEGFEAQVRPRSGLAANHGVTVLNAPGTVDADYRGEVMVILINHGSYPVKINTGDRIAQLVIAPVITASLVQAGELSDTERGTGGFGSTGVA